MEIEKKYYAIEYVAKAINKPASTIRFWESKLPHLAPKVRGNLNNNRKYQIHEIVLVQKVSDLADWGMSIRGIVMAYEKGYFDRLYAILNQFTK